MQLAEMGVYQLKPLTADKSALGQLIDSAVKYNQRDYTAASWTAFAKALSEATQTYNNAQALQSEIDKRAESLKAAAAGLVAAVRVQSVSLSASDIKLKVGKSKTVTALVAPQSAANKAVSWSTENLKIAACENGRITAKSAGVTYITVKSADGGKTARIKVIVSPGRPTNLKLKRVKKTISVEFKAAKGTGKYQIYIKPPKGKAKIKTVSKPRFTIKKLKKGKYTVRVRGYCKSGKTVLTSAYTAKKTIKIK